MKLLKSLFGSGSPILRERDFQVLLLANLMAPMGVGIMSPILDSLIEPFGTTPANIGLMISVYTAPCIVIIPLAGVLADRIGRKPIIVGSLVLFGASGTAIALTTEYPIVLGLRLLQGVGFAGLVPTIVTSIGDLFESTEEATAQGVRLSMTGFANAVVPLFAGILVAMAWFYPFLLFAVSLPIAVVVAVTMEEPTSGLDDVSVAADGGHDASGGDVESVSNRALLEFCRQPRVFTFLVARGLPQFVWIGFVAYNSVIVVRIAGGSPTQAGVLVTVIGVSYAIAASQTGRLTDVFDTRFVPLLGANVCLGAGFLWFLFAPGMVVAVPGVALTGVGFGLTSALYRSILSTLPGEALRGRVVGLGEAWGQATNTLSPVLMGAIIAATSPALGLGPALQIAGLVAALIGGLGGVVCVLIAWRTPPVEHPK